MQKIVPQLQSEFGNAVDRTADELPGWGLYETKKNGKITQWTVQQQCNEWDFANWKMYQTHINHIKKILINEQKQLNQNQQNIWIH
jgi:hypothetical protein